MADWLCTLTQAKAELKVADGDQTNDVWVADNIPLVSTRINNWTRQRYVPYIQTQYYDAFGPHIDDVYRKLDLGRSILEPTTVVDTFGHSLVLGTDYILKPTDGPWMQMQLTSLTTYGWSYGFGFGTYFWIAPGQFLNKIQVTGTWGYRTNYPDEGWTDSTQRLTNAIDATQGTLAVANVSAMNEAGEIPCLDVGHLLKVETEWMQTLAVNTTTNVLTVQRGVNGSTAAAHLAGIAVETWSVQPEIRRACSRWLGYWYTRRGAFETVKNDLAQGRVIIYPDDAPAEVVHILEQTRDWRWGVV